MTSKIEEQKKKKSQEDQKDTTVGSERLKKEKIELQTVIIDVCSLASNNWQSVEMKLEKLSTKDECLDKKTNEDGHWPQLFSVWSRWLMSESNP